jgi:hypothetical protein
MHWIYFNNITYSIVICRSEWNVFVDIVSFQESYILVYWNRATVKWKLRMYIQKQENGEINTQIGVCLYKYTPNRIDM